MQTKSEVLERKYPDHVIILLCGKFYTGRGLSACILSHLTGYKLKNCGNRQLRCSFPEQSLPRVKRLLGQNHISYVIYAGDLMEAHEDFEKDNKYAAQIAFLKDAKILPWYLENRGNENSIKAKRELTMAHSLRLQMEDPLVEFLDALCEGRHPFYGIKTDTLDLKDEEVQRILKEIRKKIKAAGREEWDWGTPEKSRPAGKSENQPK